MTTISIHKLHANLRDILATLKSSGEPVIIAEYGRWPVAVLVRYDAWLSLTGQRPGTTEAPGTDDFTMAIDSVTEAPDSTTAAPSAWWGTWPARQE